MTDDTMTTAQPHSVEAEQALIGAVFLQPDEVLDAVLPIVPDPQMFYRGAHRALWGWMKARYAEGRSDAIDWIVCANDLAVSGELEAAGGQEYLRQITEIMSMSAGASQWAEIVHEHWVKREIIRV